MDETDQYEEWDLTPVVTPIRSTLYAPEPRGVGTAFVESLTSYMTRLADAHCIFPGDLIRKLIVPRLPGYSPLKRLQGAFRDGGEQSAMFNSVGRPARDVLQILEILTLRQDLPYLTLRPLAAVIPAKPKGLIRPRKAWCPACYEEERATTHIVYDPLLWAFQEISLCTRHHIRLSTHCCYQDCARSLPWVAWRAQVGYCSYCQRWLGLSPAQVKGSSSPVAEAELRWQQWVADTLGAVLALLPPRSAWPERERIRQVVTVALHHISAGELVPFARALGMSRGMVEYWYQGEHLPEMEMLLRVCFRLGLSLSECLFHEINTLRPHLSNAEFLAPVATKKRPILQVEIVYQALELAAATDEQPPPTLLMVTRHTGHALPMLYRIHPSACRAIVARYKTYVQQQKEIRLRRLQEEIEQVTHQLRAEGIAPTQKRIASCLSQPGILRDPRVRAFLHEICCEGEEKA